MLGNAEKSTTHSSCGDGRPVPDHPIGAGVKRRTGPLARISLIRLTVFGAIALTAVLAFTLQAGVFRLFFRTTLFIGAVVLLGSYVLEWWLKRRRNRAAK